MTVGAGIGCEQAAKRVLGSSSWAEATQGARRRPLAHTIASFHSCHPRNMSVPPHLQNSTNGKTHPCVFSPHSLLLGGQCSGVLPPLPLSRADIEREGLYL